jgi:hypothetical protein
MEIYIRDSLSNGVCKHFFIRREKLELLILEALSECLLGWFVVPKVNVALPAIYVSRHKPTHALHNDSTLLRWI